MFKRKYTYIAQWGNEPWKSWWSEKEFRWGWRAKKHALKMLARNSNVSPWRVVRYDHKTKKYTIVFEGSINRKWRNLTGNIKKFTDEDIKNYYLPPIIIDRSKRRKKDEDS